MATSKEYLQFILEQLSGLENVAYRAMMGEYILYYQGKIAAYLCDGRLLMKATPLAVSLLPKARREPPYKGAKEMLLVENVDDRAFLESLFRSAYPELAEPKSKKRKGRKEAGFFAVL